MSRFLSALLALLVGLALIPPATAGAAETSDFALVVPYRSQFDGTAYAGSNCGPTAIAMVLEAYGRDLPTQQLRDEADRLLGVYDPSNGTRMEDLATIVSRFGLTTSGLDSAGISQRWTVPEVREELRAGRPVVVLTYYPLLPNHPKGGAISHYIVLVGLAGDNFLYNDSATRVRGLGYNVQITPAQLERAMAASSVPYSAFSVGPGPNDTPLPRSTPTYLELPTGRFTAR